MSKELIVGIIIDGPHMGEQISMKHMPTVHLVKKSNIASCLMDIASPPTMMPEHEVVYYECFRSIDGRCVLYSTSGCFGDIRKMLRHIGFMPKNP